MIIKGVYPEDAGTFTCRAVNSAGIAECSAQLYVPGIVTLLTLFHMYLHGFFAIPEAVRTVSLIQFCILVDYVTYPMKESHFVTVAPLFQEK